MKGKFKIRLQTIIAVLFSLTAGVVTAQNQVVVVPLGDDFDANHNHDDRYFGFGHTLQSALVDNGASLSIGNVSFPDSGSPRMTISFGLPPGRIDGRPILLQIPFRGPPNCTFLLSASGVAGPFSDSTRFLNSGWNVVGSPDGSVSLGPLPTGDNSSTAVVTFTHRSASRLAAGASVQMRLTRLADNGNDSCAGAVRARGGFSVEY